MSDLIQTALALRAQLDSDARLDPPRHLSWAMRLRGLAALVDELEDLESAASLAASSTRWPDVAGAGAWLDQELDELAAALEQPTLAGLGQALSGLVDAEASLAELVTRRRRA